MKTCIKCNLPKDLQEFRKNKNYKDGHERACKECRKEEQRISYKEKNWNEKKQARRKENPEKAIEYQRKWVNENRELYRSYDLTYRTKNSVAKNLWRSARNRAKIHNLEFSITKEDIIVPELCPIFETPLESQIGKGTKFAISPNRPSIDRIDSSKGYIKGNIWVISSLANVMKSNSTLKQLIKFSNNVLKLIENGTIF